MNDRLGQSYLQGQSYPGLGYEHLLLYLCPKYFNIDF